MSVVRVSMLLEFLEETCELLFGEVLILEHALASPANQPLQFRLSVPRPHWSPQVGNCIYGYIGLAELEVAGEELDSPRRSQEAKEMREDPVSHHKRRVVGLKD